MKALIFDMDGILVDSEPMWRLAEREVFAGIGLELDDADCERTMGMRTDEVIDHWYRRAPWNGPSPAEVEARLVARMQTMIAELAEPMPGVEHALTLARDAGFELGLASSSPPTLINAVLRKLGLERDFAVVRSAVDEEHGKPHPGVFLTTARLLGIDPGDCVVIEDSLAGVRSADAAGMRVIVVPPAHLFDEPDYDDVDEKLRSLKELTGEMLG
jgi:HAD superfamily hydrolase (TIGR01509 family)